MLRERGMPMGESLVRGRNCEGVFAKLEETELSSNATTWIEGLEQPTRGIGNNPD